VAEEMLDSAAVFRCALKGVMVAELFVPETTHDAITLCVASLPLNYI